MWRRKRKIGEEWLLGFTIVSLGEVLNQLGRISIRGVKVLRELGNLTVLDMQSSGGRLEETVCVVLFFVLGLVA